MALFKCFNIRNRKGFPWKTSLGGIHESLAQWIFPRLWYNFGMLNLNPQPEAMCKILRNVTWSTVQWFTVNYNNLE